MAEIHDRARAQLFAKAEPSVAEFGKKIIPGAEKFIGVRTATVRALAKEIAKTDWQSFLKNPYVEYQEEKALYAMVIGMAKMETEQYRYHMEQFVSIIDNWGTCDTACSSFKFAKKDRHWVWEKLQEYLRSGETYRIRFALVMMLSYFLEDAYIEDVLRISDEVQSEEYYVQMANAWLISMAYVKFPKETEAFLQKNSLDRFTQNKAIQKIRESYRVDAATKERLKQYRK